MKNNILILFLSLQTLISCGQAPTNTITNLVITNVSVVTMKNNEVLNNQDVVVKDGKIFAIEKHSKKKYKDVVVIDGKGKYIMPSLADAHVHLPENENELDRFFSLNVINGVTKLRSMRGDWKHIDWKNKYNTTENFYPKLYLSAPPIYRNYDFTAEQIEGFVKATKERGFDFIKILSIKNQDIFNKLNEICVKYNIPLGGHFPRLASGNTLDEATFFNSNYTSIEHLGGLVGEPNLFESRIEAIKKNNMFICPTLSWYSIGSGQHSYEELQKLPGMEYVSNETMQEWLNKTKQYREKLGEQAYKEEVAKELKDLDEKYQVIARLQKEGIKMLLSPDASSKYMMTGCNMLTEMELLQNANLSNFEILQMATTNFSDFFNANYGLIKVGKDADFIVLDKNPLEDLQTLKNVKGVYFNFNYIDTKTLEEMKKKLLVTASK